MNNAQFRRLVLDTPRAKPANNDNDNSRPFVTPARKDGGGVSTSSSSSGALGSKMRSSIPMTPRSVTGVDFARQLAERDNHHSGQSNKKFRSSAAPKGVKLPAGYRDRTQTRDDDDGDGNGSTQAADDPAARIAALEEMVKKGEMEQDTFEKLRDEIVGGDIGTTHLVRGLDYKLLERVRKGEDVLKGDAKKEDDDGREEKEEVDAKLDEEFEKLEEKEVVPVVKTKGEESKKTEMLPPPLPPQAVAGKKRSRNEILAELKASRKAAAEAAAAAAQPALGPKFKKVGEKREKTRIERDERGREVLITVDENGRVKRKVRKGGVNGSGDAGRSAALPMPEKDAKPLGMDVPETLLSKNGTDGDEQNATEANIFEDAGSDYDPLAGLEENTDDDDDDSVDGSDEERDLAASVSRTGRAKDNEIDSTAPAIDSVADEHQNDNAATNTIPPKEPPPELSLSTKPSPPPAPRNYFATSTTEDTTANSTSTNPNITKSQFNPLSDPSILAALRKASTLDPSHLQSRTTTNPTNPNTLRSNTNEDNDEDEESRRSRLREKLLSSASHDRDAEDLDMGFGSSRFDDVEDLEEDASGKRVKLSVWNSGSNKDGGGGGGGDEGGGKQKRKRGPKKKKGDKNSAADVLKIVEQRKKKN